LFVAALELGDEFFVELCRTPAHQLIELTRLSGLWLGRLRQRRHASAIGEQLPQDARRIAETPHAAPQRLLHPERDRRRHLELAGGGGAHERAYALVRCTTGASLPGFPHPFARVRVSAGIEAGT